MLQLKKNIISGSRKRVLEFISDIINAAQQKGEINE